MEMRTLGTQGPDLSLLALGSWYTYPRLTFESCVDLIKQSLDSGINTFDVAYYPRQPHNEILFKAALDDIGPKRDSIRIMEKLWFWDDPEQSLSKQMDGILRRIGDDYVDVIMCEHLRPGMDVENIAEQLGQIVASGRALSWTGMDWSPADIVRADDYLKQRNLPRPQGLEMKYNVARQSVVDTDEFRALAARGISLIPSDTLEGGILAGRQELTRGIGIDTGNIRDEIYRLAADLEPVAADHDVTTAQLSLAFAAANAGTATVVFGATRPEHLADNVKALDLLKKLGAEKINEILRPFAIAGHTVDLPYNSKPRLGDTIVR